MHRLVCVSLVLIGLSLSSLSPVVAQVSALSGFEPFGDYLLEVNGTVDKKAEVFLQRRLPALLVLPSGSNTPLMLSIRSRAVQSVNIMKMTKTSAGMMDLSSDAIMGSKGVLTQEAGTISFAADDTQYRLVEKPVFLGLARASKVEAYADSYKNGAAAYAPDAAAMATIRGAETKVHVRVYFGSWCPFCKRYVPNIIKVANEVNAENVTIDFYGLPKGISSDPVAGQAKVNSVPTAVVFSDGEEVGRLSQDDWRAPEKALAKILKGR